VKQNRGRTVMFKSAQKNIPIRRKEETDFHCSQDWFKKKKPDWGRKASILLRWYHVGEKKVGGLGKEPV